MSTCFCDKCKKTMDEGQFYTYHDGSKTELCKKCLTLHINNFDESTYVWLLEKMDVPYVPGEWIVLREKALAKAAGNPLKLNGMSVFGKYLSKMKLKQFKDCRWADSARLQAEAEQKRAVSDEQLAELDAMYQEQYDKGEITEAQYKTLVSATARNANFFATLQPTQPVVPETNFFDETKFIDDSELPDPAAQLTQEDKIAMAIKWGKLYTPGEWVILETDYAQMMESFDIQDADSKNTLILLCKTNLKANQAIDSGDIEGYQKLAKVADSLRKSAKFTAQQNKEDKGDFVDSIGQLIAICEKDGFIPRFATDIPQDKVDMTLKDMNAYVHKLVTQDLGFGQQIEDSLRKIMLQNEMNKEAEERQAAEGDDYDPYAPTELSDEDIVDYYDTMLEMKEQDRSLFEGE